MINTDNEWCSPSEAVDYLNTRLQINPPLNLARLARLRRDNRVCGKLLTRQTAFYRKADLDAVRLEDIQDKRGGKRNKADVDKLTIS
jgi:hypothetical protein